MFLTPLATIYTSMCVNLLRGGVSTGIKRSSKDLEIAPPTFVSGPTTLEIQKEQDRDHDQGENQKLSLYQALSLKTLLADYLLLIAYKAEEDNDEKHKPSTQALSYHNVSQSQSVHS